LTVRPALPAQDDASNIWILPLLYVQ
jgi:hypothetical protein